MDSVVIISCVTCVPVTRSLSIIQVGGGVRPVWISRDQPPAGDELRSGHNRHDCLTRAIQIIIYHTMASGLASKTYLTYDRMDLKTAFTPPIFRPYSGCSLQRFRSEGTWSNGGALPKRIAAGPGCMLVGINWSTQFSKFVIAVHFLLNLCSSAHIWGSAVY